MSADQEVIGKLQSVISNGQYIGTHDQWSEILQLIPSLIDSIIKDTYKTELHKEIIVDPLKVEVKSTIERFRDEVFRGLGVKFKSSPPFTVVRLTEVLVEPTRYYSTAEKFLRALKNICCVSSNVDDFSRNVADQRAKDEAKSTNGDNGSYSVLTDEAQVILLTKIDWLTEEDKKEVENEGYLNDGFSFTKGIFDHYSDDCILGEDVEDPDYVDEEEEEGGALNSDGDSFEDDEPVRKRKVEATISNTIADESPEKKLKTAESTKVIATSSEQSDTSVSDEANEEVQEQEKEEINPDTTLEEDKMQVD